MAGDQKANTGVCSMFSTHQDNKIIPGILKLWSYVEMQGVNAAKVKHFKKKTQQRGAGLIHARERCSLVAAAA